ncbi:hypothetical protein NKR23_g3321 [Pleurostoma richardsiae]|uniref:Uncharacterized protein n=1 Tax=Pleurostoma richardsiae TaxID=41990 RepID=A0AA38RLZ6_9PEZI|nr:hypothetical protein NKR23_g3321 [Pleurostoma richardsiae]
MCIQYNFLFKCGHRGFDKFHNCPEFGRSCLGAGGNHKDTPVQDICSECKRRAIHQADGKKDPWWEDDPWRKRRQG